MDHEFQVMQKRKYESEVGSCSAKGGPVRGWSQQGRRIIETRDAGEIIWKECM